MTIVNAAAAKKISQDHKIARSIGFVPSQSLFTIGSQVEATKHGFNAKRSRFDKLPLAADALEATKNEISNEQRRSFVVDLSDTAMAAGDIVTKRGDFGISRNAFADLAKHLPMAHANSALASVDADLRSFIYNELNKTAPVKILTRKNSSSRSIFGVTSPNYQEFHSDTLLEAVLEEVDFTGAKADIQYDPESTRLSAKILWFNDHDDKFAGTGDIFQSGIEISTGDTAKNALKVSMVIFVNRCLNYIIVAEDKVEVGNFRHYGKRSLGPRVRMAITTAQERLSVITSQWIESARDNLLKKLDKTDIEGVFDTLISRGFARVPGVKNDKMKARLLRAWAVEPGYSTQSFIQAITRAAHTETWGSRWVTRDLEANAGRLLQTVSVREW